MRVFIESKRKLVSGMDMSFFPVVKNPLILRYNSVDTPSILHRYSIDSPSFRWRSDGHAMEMRWRCDGDTSEEEREKMKKIND